MKRVAWLVAASLVLAAGDASADEPDDSRAIGAFAAGAGLMLGSAAAGLTVEGADVHRVGKDYAIASAQAGMMLAPILAHGIVDEWERGLWFSIPGAAGFLGSTVIFAAIPDIVKRGPPIVQYALSGTLTLSIFGNTIGVLDAMFAGHRARARAAASKSSAFSIRLAPTFGGAMLMGTL